MTRRLISSGSPFEAEVGYSRAVVQGDWIFVAGTTGFDYSAMTISDRLEEQTEQRGAGRTLAQFLIGHRRYDGETGAYFPDRRAPKCGDFRTVIIDECSMLTEDQLAALFDACTNVERYVLVGDPRQLPPIGAGRPLARSSGRPQQISQAH